MSNDRYEETLDALAHEIWAVAQLTPGEGILDGVDRIVALLRREGYPAITNCDKCGCSWLDDGVNPIGCPYCQHIDWRAVNAELLPLPVGEDSSFGNYEVHDNEAMVAYARANIARAVAPLRELEERAQRDAALLRQALEALGRAAHQTAMEQTLKARIPECAEFAGIANDLDFAVSILR